MKPIISRVYCGLLFGAALLASASTGAYAQGAAYPNHNIELVVPFQAGGGTDALARAFAESARKHLPQNIIVINKPGASGAIGWAEVANAKADGYKLSLLTADIAIVPHLGLTKLTYENLMPVARLNADPSAITVRADSPYKTVEAFLDAARKNPGTLRIGNAGNGSIWHLAATALEDKTGTKFNHIPFQGGNPAVLALLGGHIDAVTVSPAEVYPYVAAGKLKTLAVMADKRVKGFETVPTLKESKVDLSIGTWRGIAVPLNTPPEVVSVLRTAIAQTVREPALKEMMDKQNLGLSYADQDEFKAAVAKDNAYFKSLIAKVGMKQ
ncbi:Bug family tripartite tricarboxylate transporter substrate binding protein [Cupriavidus taiwanensis]|uniref:Putative BUG-like extracytoplasmic solute binding receptor, TTT family n=1 Tax=Cupriavidus taiwanensis TaxID=164546 RepID=A0A375IZ57_9BURK|nr:tripartite tricarboxylate transporter substrate binding protein [Cupriavidus taiwanensis]SPR96386.1 putative BUG-like extracytoplasmic solute binding receptor, TTT family [Cupriavidus taiwanensis]